MDLKGQTTRCVRHRELSDVVTLYNSLADRSAFYYPITVETLRTALIPSSENAHEDVMLDFDADGLLVAYNGAEPQGFIHVTTRSAAVQESPFLSADGYIRCFFFPEDRPDIGGSLLETGVNRLFEKGCETISAFHWATGYPFYQCGHGALHDGFSTHLKLLTDCGFVPKSLVMMSRDVTSADLKITTGFKVREVKGKSMGPGPGNVVSVQALVGDQQIGLCQYIHWQEFSERTGIATYYIVSLGIEEQYRRKGIGKGLVQRVIKNIVQAGGQQVYINVAENNTPAKSLYAQLDFKPVFLSRVFSGERYHYAPPSDHRH